MAYTSDLKWRGLVLYLILAMDAKDIVFLLGISRVTLFRWVKIFQETGTINSNTGRNVSARWPDHVYIYAREYIKAHPCFYLEELQAALKYNFPTQSNFSTSTICRALHFDLGLTRKILEKRAREAQPKELESYIFRLRPYFFHSAQLIFIDETSKDGRSSLRKYAYSQRGTPAIVTLPFSRGRRVSALAAFGNTGIQNNLKLYLGILKYIIYRIHRLGVYDRNVY